MKTITIKDETAAGKVLHEIALQFEKEYITAKELIIARITEELKNYEDHAKNYMKGLVLPTDMEARLNRSSKPKIDLEKQIYVALDAFTKNAYFILVDDEQVDELEQKILVDESTIVSFIKLTPLVGG